ncbi:MAG: pentapeptide repeat-containing protein [Oscillospiraceae bacterium]|jgi:uncharacterized protein YjbI with pentapeptide repeats|nr:pentapeptide repeat-containing protein [Oscillospiraceae bacterium]
MKRRQAGWKWTLVSVLAPVLLAVEGVVLYLLYRRNVAILLTETPLLLRVGVSFVLCLPPALAIFALVHRVGKRESTYELVRTTGLILGALTVGVVAMLQLSQQQVSEGQFALAQDTKYSERLVAAIDHLGSSEITIRKGAVYELKRLAFDSEKDRDDVIDILSSFVVEESQKRPKDDKNPLASDIMTALQMLSDARTAFPDSKPAQLAGVNLSFSVIPNINLSYANFERANLTNASLMHAKLVHAVFWEADISEADLRYTNLTSAVFTDATLARANLKNANLSRADLAMARLANANLYGANLTDANLDHTYLYKAHLSCANLTRARLYCADLTGVNFWQTDLTETNFFSADLANAFLNNAKNLTAEQLDDANIDGTTVLPDDLR